MKTAVIDIGSNSVRYALYDGQDAPTKKELSSTVLADGLFFSGRLSAAAIARTADAVDAYCRKAREKGADEILLFATEAVRAARNGKEFTDAVLARTGIAVDVIEGAVEAQIGFLGASPDPARTVAVFDMGGASCEVTCGKDGALFFTKSCPVGCVRLHDGAGADRNKAQALLDAALPASLPAVELLVGIGGTATALGAMLHCPDRYDPRITHGSIVPRDFLEQTATRFFAGENLLAAYPSLTVNRARIIGYGALAALSLLDRLHLPAFTVSERDNMEGYLLYKKSHK